MIKIPQNFDGAKFAAKYNLDPFKDFYVNRGDIICLSLPNLTEEDLLDCIADPPSQYEESIKPLKAPSITVEDIYIATPDIPEDEAAALAEAVKEFDKGRGAKKSMGVMLLASVKVIKKMAKEITDLKNEVDKLKKKVK